jgi:hypothetical protein
MLGRRAVVFAAGAGAGSGGTSFSGGAYGDLGAGNARSTNGRRIGTSIGNKLASIFCSILGTLANMEPAANPVTKIAIAMHVTMMISLAI